jgi:DNA-binding transcriptional ArsR family regulator
MGDPKLLQLDGSIPVKPVQTDVSRGPKRLETLLVELGTKIGKRDAAAGGPPPTKESVRPENLKGSLRNQIPPVRERALTPAELTERLTAPLEPKLHRTALKIYRALHETALHVARARGYAPQVSQVSFHIPAEITAFALSMHRSTLYRHLPALRDSGLVDSRAHYTTHNRRTVTDGTVWSVKMVPGRGKRARVGFDHLKHKWRDLAADISSGRTAYRVLRQSETGEGGTSTVEVLLTWALPENQTRSPLCMTVAAGPEVVLDVPYAPQKERGKMVDLAARGICQYLGDDSLNFYRYLLWRLLRLHDQGQDYFAPFHTMILRAGTDHREGFARSAGALLTSRLKRWEVWELLRVGR